MGAFPHTKAYWRGWNGEGGLGLPALWLLQASAQPGPQAGRRGWQQLGMEVHAHVPHWHRNRELLTPGVLPERGNPICTPALFLL